MSLQADDSTLIIVAIIGSVGPTIAVVANIILNQRIAIRKQNLLNITARVADARLVKIQKSADVNLGVTQATHSLVDGQASISRRLVASLSRRIARENPADDAAQIAAAEAEKDAELPSS